MDEDLVASLNILGMNSTLTLSMTEEYGSHRLGYWYSQLTPPLIEYLQQLYAFDFELLEYSKYPPLM